MFDIICQKYDLCKKHKIYNKKKLRNQLFQIQPKLCHCAKLHTRFKYDKSFIPFKNQRSPLGNLINSSSHPQQNSLQIKLELIKQKVAFTHQIQKNTRHSYQDPQVVIILKKNKDLIQKYREGKLLRNKSQPAAAKFTQTTFFDNNSLLGVGEFIEENVPKSEKNKHFVKQIKKRMFCLQTNRIFKWNRTHFGQRFRRKGQQQQVGVEQKKNGKRIKNLIKRKIQQVRVYKNKFFEQQF